MSFEEFEEFDDDHDEEEEEEIPEIDIDTGLELEFLSDDKEGERERFGEDRVAAPFLGSLAKARLIAARAGQLAQGAVPLISVRELGTTEMSAIARKEFEEALKGNIVFPIKLLLRFPNGWVESWAISEFRYVARD